MSESRALFNEALRKSVADSYSYVPTEKEITHNFSDRFLRRLKRIHLPDEAPLLFFLQKKRIAVLVLVFIFLLVSLGCAVPQIREELADRFIAAYKYYYTVYWKNPTQAEYIEEYYLPAVLPEGFSLTHCKAGTDILSALYEKSTSDGKIEKIEFYQQLIPKNGLSFTKQDGKFSDFEHNGQAFDVYELYDKKTVFYEKEGYLFKVLCRNNMPIEQIAEMLLSVEVKSDIL